MISVDELSQEIRRVDGNHDKGAGALAEALVPFLERALSASPAGVVKPLEAIRAAGLKARDELLERMADGGTVDNDLADYMERIVDACVNSARIMSAIEPAGAGADLVERVENCVLFSTPAEYAGLADHAAFEAGQDNAIACVVKMFRDTLKGDE